MIEYIQFNAVAFLKDSKKWNDEKKQVFYYACNKLTEAQNEVLDVFFFRRGYITPLIKEYGIKYGLCRSDVYKARREALDELARIIMEHIIEQDEL